MGTEGWEADGALWKGFGVRQEQHNSGIWCCCLSPGLRADDLRGLDGAGVVTLGPGVIQHWHPINHAHWVGRISPF